MPDDSKDDAAISIEIVTDSGTTLYVKQRFPLASLDGDITMFIGLYVEPALNVLRSNLGK